MLAGGAFIRPLKHSNVRQDTMESSQTSTAGSRGRSPLDIKADRLEDEFRPQGRAGTDGALLLWSTEAIDLVNRAADEGVPIVRITCVIPGNGQPSRDASVEHRADYSREVCDGHGCWEAAEAFIRRRGELGLLFRVELGDDPLEII